MPYIETEEIKIYYETHGQGEPLLLIHGLGSSGKDWEPQVDFFSSNFQVITMDLRGHGRSGKPPGPYSMESIVEDVALLLKGMDFFPAHVMGISLGGMVAFQLALDWPKLIRKLVIVNSVPELVPRGIGDLMDYWQRLLIINLMGMEKMGRVLAERFFTEPGQEFLRQTFIRHWSENHKPSYRASLKAIYGWSVRDRLGEIKAPTLVVGSEGDFFPTKDKEAYTALIPEAELVVIENSKHALPAEKPDVFNQAVMSFLFT